MLQVSRRIPGSPPRAIRNPLSMLHAWNADQAPARTAPHSGLGRNPDRATMRIIPQFKHPPKCTSPIPKPLRTLERGADAKVPEMEGQEPGDLAEPLAQHEHPLLLKAALPARVDALFRSWDTGVPTAGIKTRQRLAVASRSLPALR
jgi:hypothetical protein